MSEFTILGAFRVTDGFCNYEHPGQNQKANAKTLARWKGLLADTSNGIVACPPCGTVTLTSAVEEIRVSVVK